jgi:hypothetical protein
MKKIINDTIGLDTSPLSARVFERQNSAAPINELSLNHEMAMSNRAAYLPSVVACLNQRQERFDLIKQASSLLVNRVNAYKQN